MGATEHMRLKEEKEEGGLHPSSQSVAGEENATSPVTAASPGTGTLHALPLALGFWEKQREESG